MKELKFPLLSAEHIECRVGTIKEKGVTLLLYKDARVDMKILDEVVGWNNWQREHKELKGNIYCGVSIFDEERGCWVTKWDCGKESNTEAEKGEASDSFKRACVNVGIGRELYTAPLIYVGSDKCKITTRNGKFVCDTYFEVSEIDYDSNRRINKLVIIDESSGAVVYSYGTKKTYTSTKTTSNDKTPTETPKNAQTSQNSGLSAVKGTINANQKICLESYISGLDTARSQRFMNYMDKAYGTMNYESLSEQQADELIKLTLPKDKR